MTVISIINIDSSDPQIVPGLRLILELRNTLFCLQSDKKSDEEKELICFTLEFILGYRKEKISRIKEKLLREFNEINESFNKIQDPEKKDNYYKRLFDIKDEIYSFKLSLFDICPFTCNRIELKSNILDIKRRKLMDKFTLIVEYNTILKYTQEDKFFVLYSLYSDISKINLKLTYRVNI